MEKSKVLRVIESDYLAEIYKLEFEAYGTKRDTTYDEEIGYFDEYLPYSTLLYKSENNYILFSNIGLEGEGEELYDINELVNNCLILETPTLYIREQINDSIYRLEKDTHYILHIYQLFDTSVYSCLIDDLDFYERFKKAEYMDEIAMIDNYELNSKISSGEDGAWCSAEIKDGKYKKYQIKRSINDEQD